MRSARFRSRSANATASSALSARKPETDPPSPSAGGLRGRLSLPSAVTTVRTGPRPDLLLVVNKGAGFLVPVGDPDAAIELGLSPVTGVAVSPQDDMLVAADFTHLAGFG